MHQILNKIADDLKIIRLPNEPEYRFEARIVYSAMAQHIKFSSLDKSIYEETHSRGASIIHTKKRCCDIFEQLLLCSPSAREWFEPELMSNIEIIYNRLVSFGELLKFYDRYNMVAPQKQYILNDNISYFRGVAYNYMNKKTSGLALLEQSTKRRPDASYIYELLPMSSEKSVDFWKRYIKNIDYEPLFSTENLECFDAKMKSKSLYDCFVEMNEIPEGYTLARKPLFMNDYIFYVLKRKGNRLLYHPIEDFYKSTKEHYKFRYALRYLNDNPIMAEYIINNDMIELHINSMLPNTEMAFLQLISWPKTNISDTWNFTFSKEFLGIIEAIFDNIQIKLMEKKYAAV